MSPPWLASFPRSLLTLPLDSLSLRGALLGAPHLSLILNKETKSHGRNLEKQMYHALSRPKASVRTRALFSSWRWIKVPSSRPLCLGVGDAASGPTTGRSTWFPLTLFSPLTHHPNTGDQHWPWSWHLCSGCGSGWDSGGDAGLSAERAAEVRGPRERGHAEN